VCIQASSGFYRLRLIISREKNCRLLRASDTFTLRDSEEEKWRRRWWLEELLIRQLKNRARCIAPGFSTPLFALTIRSLQPVILWLTLPTISACRCLLVILLLLFYSWSPSPLRLLLVVTPPFLRLVREIYDRMSWNSDSASVPFLR